MRFKDKDSGIIFGVNPEAFDDPEHLKYVTGLVKDMSESLDSEPVDDNNKCSLKSLFEDEINSVIPFDDKCKFIKGYAEFEILLLRLCELYDELNDQVKLCLYSNIDTPIIDIRKNFDDLVISKYCDVEHICDVIDLKILKDGKYLPEWNINDMYHEYLKLKEDKRMG